MVHYERVVYYLLYTKAAFLLPFFVHVAREFERTHPNWIETVLDYVRNGTQFINNIPASRNWSNGMMTYEDLFQTLSQAPESFWYDSCVGTGCAAVIDGFEEIDRTRVFYPGDPLLESSDARVEEYRRRRQEANKLADERAAAEKAAKRKRKNEDVDETKAKGTAAADTPLAEGGTAAADTPLAEGGFEIKGYLVYVIWKKPSINEKAEPLSFSRTLFFPDAESLRSFRDLIETMRTQDMIYPTEYEVHPSQLRYLMHGEERRKLIQELLK